MIHLPRLPPQLAFHRLICNVLLALVQVARPARGQGYSGFGPGLKHANGAPGERKEEGKAPPASSACDHQERSQDQARAKHDGAEKQTFTSLARADVLQADC